MIHNLFRIGEFIFGRKNGIRCENRTTGRMDEDGVMHVFHEFYTIESILAFVEQTTYKILKNTFTWDWSFIKVKVYVPAFAGVNNVPKGFGGYMFAIAYDDVSANFVSSATAVTVSHTASGANRIGILAGVASDVMSAEEWDGNAMTSGVENSDFEQLHYYIAPSTSSVTVEYTAANPGAHAIVATTYTGVKQTSPIDGTQTGSGTASTHTLTVTTGTANSMLVDLSKINGETSATTTEPSQTKRSGQIYASNRQMVTSDRPLTSAGAEDISWSHDNVAWRGCAMGLLEAPTVTPTKIEKSLKYTVLKEISVTKSIKYTVFSDVAIQKSIKYTVETTPSAMTKSLEYRIVTDTAITKGLHYEVESQVAVQKSLKYTIITTPSAITKSLEYTILTDTGITKSIEYQVIKEIGITKGIEYAILTDTNIQKGLQYEVLSDVAIQKSLKYTVIQTPSAITKGIDYHIQTDTNIQKSIEYLVTSQQVVQKSLKYVIETTPSAITKGIEYAILIPDSITKSLKYSVETSTAIEKELCYAVAIASEVITKAIQYKVTSQVKIEKALRYEIQTEAVITKSLQYIVTGQEVITKSLQYEIRTYPYNYQSKRGYKPFH